MLVNAKHIDIGYCNQVQGHSLNFSKRESHYVKVRVLTRL